jgi:hypothetical protein
MIVVGDEENGGGIARLTHPHPRGPVPARRACLGATFRPGHNRRKCDQPINQPKNTANPELSKTPAATPSHYAQIETLAMASCRYRTTQGRIAPETVDEPLIDPSPPSSSTRQIYTELAGGRYPTGGTSTPCHRGSAA